MTKPSIEEITDYFFEKLQDMELARNEADTFFNYYSSCGWYVGKKPMKAWRFAVLNWIKRIKPRNDGSQSISDIRNLFH